MAAAYKVGTFEVKYTRHGRRRAQARRIKEDGIRAALLYGRRHRSYGEWIYQIDRRTLAKAAAEGTDLLPFKGVTVVATGDDTVVTVFRYWQGRRVAA